MSGDCTQHARTQCGILYLDEVPCRLHQQLPRFDAAKERRLCEEWHAMSTDGCVCGRKACCTAPAMVVHAS